MNVRESIAAALGAQKLTARQVSMIVGESAANVRYHLGIMRDEHLACCEGGRRGRGQEGHWCLVAANVSRAGYDHRALQEAMR